MEPIVALVVAGFIIIAAVDGTLWTIALQGVAGVAVFCVVETLGLGGRRNASVNVVGKLNKDLQYLRRCKQAELDTELCLTIGSEAGSIRKAINAAESLVEILNDKRNANLPEVLALFGGRTPLSCEMGALKQEYRDKIRTLRTWLDDPALRGLLKRTGKLLTPEGVRHEIETRETRISQLKSDYRTRGAFDHLASRMLGWTTFLFPAIGLTGAGAYVALHELNKRR